jgi:hypothetical protein
MTNKNIRRNIAIKRYRTKARITYICIKNSRFKFRIPKLRAIQITHETLDRYLAWNGKSPIKYTIL